MTHPSKTQRQASSLRLFDTCWITVWQQKKCRVRCVAELFRRHCRTHPRRNPQARVQAPRSGVRHAYTLMGENYALVIRDDRTEPLVVMRLDDSLSS